MQRTSKFLNLALAALLLTQSAGLAVACAVPCAMRASLKLRCVVAELEGRRTTLQAAKGAPVLAAQPCGSLSLKGPQQALQPAKADLGLQGLASLPGAEFTPVVFVPKIFDSKQRQRAGPRSGLAAQASLPVPPQNAPPVLV
jgi:hypothetical protein